MVTRAAPAVWAGEAPAFDDSRRVTTWLADRDGDRVFGLDADHLLRTRQTLRRPLRVEARRDGGVWVVHAHGRKDEPHALTRLDEWGVPAATVALEEVRDLASWRGREALVLEHGRGGMDRVLRISGSGRTRTLFEGSELSAIAAEGDRVYIANRAGVVRALDLLSEDIVLTQAPCGGRPVLALEVVPSAIWLLSGGEETTLTRLDTALRARSSTRVQLTAETLIAARDGSVWVPDRTRPTLGRFHGSGLFDRQVRSELVGLGRGISGPDGEVWVVAPGALLIWDAQGEPRPGQGGFEFLVDVSRVP